VSRIKRIREANERKKYVERCADDSASWQSQMTKDTDFLLAEIDRLTAVDRERPDVYKMAFEQMASDVLCALSGLGHSTPEEGYVNSPWLVKGDIERALRSTDSPSVDRKTVQEAIDKLNDLGHSNLESDSEFNHNFGAGILWAASHFRVRVLGKRETDSKSVHQKEKE